MGDGILYAYDAADGRELWRADFPPEGEMCPKDVFVINGEAYLLKRDDKKITGLDIHTGEKRVEFLPQVQPAYFHPRCHRYKATINYIIPSSQGFQLVDVKNKTWNPFFWIRGSCFFGYLPANGMLYLPPGPCACFADTMLHGTYALAPRTAWLDELKQVNDASRLEKGSAYANVQTYASGQFHLTRQFYPAGQIMVLDDQHAFTYARHPEMRMWLPRTVTDCYLMRTALKPTLQPLSKKSERKSEKTAKWNERQTFVSDWAQDLPIYPRAMAKAADRLFVGGPPAPKTSNAEALRASWAGQRGGALLLVDPNTGATQQELPLESPPVWDGMIAAAGRVFIAQTDGKIICLQGAE